MPDTPASNDLTNGDPRRRLEQVLNGMKEGLYPVCTTCGERIEMERLLEDPAARFCWTCSRAHGSPPGP